MLKGMIAKVRGDIAARTAEFNTLTEELNTLRGKDALTAEDEARVAEIRTAKGALKVEIDTLSARADDLQSEHDQDEAVARLQSVVTPANVRTPAYDEVARVGQEKRTYSRDSDPKGMQFLRDVGAQFLRVDAEADDRLSRHMQEERVERGNLVARAAGSAAFSGLVVPQYLVDMFAPKARAGRPFADACRSHDLPEKGMTVNIAAVTTGTTVDDQAAENTAVSETDIDDTNISVPVRTAAGQATLSRQSIERGVGTEEVTIDDLIRAYSVNLDSKLLNTAAVGLSAVASSIAYTDGTPTGAELYPKLINGIANVEGLLLDQDPGDTIAVMHSRRWYWLQGQMTTSWPLFGQPGVGAQNAGVNYAERYGSGFRGLLPNGTPVVVDNNIATNLGAGTNEDEIYLASQAECHLWEDPSAPMLIRAEQTKASTLGVLLVVYGYYAYLFNRRTHAQKVAGTGLITPVYA